MQRVFDETIFTDGFSIRGCDSVGVSNNADRYLAQRLGITPVNHCAEATNVINLNPASPCIGTNVYTMDVSSKDILRSERFNQIEVVRADRYAPIAVGEHVAADTYTVGRDLSDLESAIMVKYFAINNNGVRISPHLYCQIHRHFADTRAWFKHDVADVVLQTPDGEIVCNGEYLELPDLTYSGPPIFV